MCIMISTVTIRGQRHMPNTREARPTATVIPSARRGSHPRPSWQQRQHAGRRRGPRRAHPVIYTTDYWFIGKWHGGNQLRMQTSLDNWNCHNCQKWICISQWFTMHIESDALLSARCMWLYVHREPLTKAFRLKRVNYRSLVAYMT